MCLFKNFILYYLLGVLVHYSASANSCSNIFSKISKSLMLKNSVHSSKPFSDFNSSDPLLFAEQITKGMLLREGQDKLFDFYITHFFPYAQNLDPSLQTVFTLLKEYPRLNLSKIPVREQIIQLADPKPALSDNFKNFVSSFRKTSSQTRNNLFQVEANYGFWIKLLNFPKKHKNDFINYLNTTALNKEVRDFIKDTSQDYQKRTITLYQALDQIKNSLPKGHKISQVMVELVHVAGFGNKFLTDQLKTKDTTQNIETVKEIIKERDLIAQRLGFSNFIELQQSENSHVLDIQKILQSENVVQPSNTKKKVFRLRVLTIQESPYRSCLSGDCSSWFYFKRALDPNYLYFTLTDSKHRSSGHVTVVLGTAKHKEKWMRTKVAFVDKIQNIPVHQVSAVLEGIRLSLVEQGYQLGLPVQVGDRNGLSNDDNLRLYVKEVLLSKLENPLNQFKPHVYYNNFISHRGFSRAEDRLDLLEWKDIKLENEKIVAGEFPIIRTTDKQFKYDNLQKTSNKDEQ